MRTVILKLIGPSIYVPHDKDKVMLGVLPNGTHLGSSKTDARDGAPLARHWPVVWDERFDKDGNKSLSFPEEFLGSRLVVRFKGLHVTPSDLDLTAIGTIAQKGWIDIDPMFLEAKHHDYVSAQVLLTQGKVELLKEPAGGCATAWSSGGSGWSLDTVPAGLTVTVEKVERVEIEALSYIGLSPKEVYYRDMTNDPNPLTVHLGNVCAENIAEWLHNSAGGRSNDTDFLWTYYLSKKSLADLVDANGKLRAPVVKGSPVDAADRPEDAFRSVRKAGGNVGCECRICLDKAKDFTY